jgi:hypothetical protein
LKQGELAALGFSAAECEALDGGVEGGEDRQAEVSAYDFEDSSDVSFRAHECDAFRSVAEQDVQTCG